MPSTQTTESANWLFDTYAPTSDAYDEMLEQDGSVRPAWKKYQQLIQKQGQEAFHVRWQQARKQIIENGTTYNVYSDGRETEHAWQLDPMPCIIDGAEWLWLDDALKQRTRLLNMILLDVYGQQRLLHEKILPPELIFAHPRFLRACHGITLPLDCMLHLSAVDVTRRQTGQYVAVADRTQAADGAGYALENRIIIGEAFTDVISSCKVKRLAPWFEHFYEMLQSIAPKTRDTPRVAVLTPGPQHPTYFEHSFLARYLGLPLVQGQDLTVRDNRVYLKTVEGLQNVDVLLRRQDDVACDPLELDNSALNGVAGLVDCLRDGNITIANALGSSWAESPALVPFLPMLCRHLLGEELKLPSLDTWWCGNDKELQYVLDHLNALVIKPAFRIDSKAAIDASLLTGDERSALIQKIQQKPWAYVGQERIHPSTQPSMENDRAKAFPSLLRTFIARTTDDYDVMPGGLSRVSLHTNDSLVSIKTTSGTKDVWLIADDAEPRPPSLLDSKLRIPLRRSGTDLPSRVVDNLFWLARYAERCEVTTRLARGIMNRLTAESHAPKDVLTQIATLLVDNELLPEDTDVKDHFALETLIPEHLLDPDNPNGLVANVDLVHVLGGKVRDRISHDTYRLLRQWYTRLDAQSIAFAKEEGGFLILLNQMMSSIAAFSGMAHESMTREPGWYFLDMGRRLERSIGTIMLLRGMLVKPTEHERDTLSAVLEMGNSSITYRSRYLNQIAFAPVLDLMLTDECNPRAVAFQVQSILASIDKLPPRGQTPQLSSERHKARAIAARLVLVDVYAMAEVKKGERKALAALLDEIEAQLNDLSTTISNAYLSHIRPQLHRGLLRGGR